MITYFLPKRYLFWNIQQHKGGYQFSALHSWLGVGWARVQNLWLWDPLSLCNALKSCLMVPHGGR